jgi:hypothetical protein
MWMWQSVMSMQLAFGLWLLVFSTWQIAIGNGQLAKP